MKALGLCSYSMNNEMLSKSETFKMSLSWGMISSWAQLQNVCDFSWSDLIWSHDYLPTYIVDSFKIQFKNHQQKTFPMTVSAEPHTH